MSYHPNPVREIIASSYGGPEKLYALADQVLSALSEAGWEIVKLDQVGWVWPEPADRPDHEDWAFSASRERPFEFAERVGEQPAFRVTSRGASDPYQ